MDIPITPPTIPRASPGPAANLLDVSTVAAFGAGPVVPPPPSAAYVEAPVTPAAPRTGPITPPTVPAEDSSGEPPRVYGIYPPGTVFSGKFRVERQLGQGGFANVYLVTDTESYLHEQLVLKVPHVDRPTEELARHLRSQFKAWKVLADTEPRYITRLLDVTQLEAPDRRVIGILMEHLPGGSLGSMVRKQWNGHPRTREQLARLMQLALQICRGVGVLHASGLVHRDLKPGNLLLDEAQTVCKLSDFELLAGGPAGEALDTAGTPPYMAPECFQGRFTPASDIFAIGATLYELLTGARPLEVGPIFPRPTPADPSTLNPLVPPELSQLVLRCLSPDPEHRPPSVEDLESDLLHLGLAEEGANTAPVNLARLLLSRLGPDDLAFLAGSLEQQGFRSARADPDRRHADLVREYCYTASPRDVLADNFSVRELARLAATLGIDAAPTIAREELIGKALTALGFLPGPRPIPGLSTTRGFVEGQLLNLAHATTADECSGMVQSGLSAVERLVELLVRFYAQLLYGSGWKAFLARQAGGKPWDRLTFGQKVGALRALCLESPAVPLADRVRQVFDWPVIPPGAFAKLDELVQQRNRLAHRTDQGPFQEAQRTGRQALSVAVELLAELEECRNVPSVVQVVSRQDDVYGRHFYLGRDDRARTERIFTPLPLAVGALYLFFPLTNPVRIDPLIFPYET